MKTITVISGWQRGGNLLEWDGKQFNQLRRAPENNWHDDGDGSFSQEIQDSFKGAVVRYRAISTVTYHREPELIGFTPEELAGPSPVSGWAKAPSPYLHASDSWYLGTFCDYLNALARGASIHTIEQAISSGTKHSSGNGKVLFHLGLEAGDQAADAWVVLDKDGHILNGDSGVADCTPYPIETADGWKFSSQAEDREREQAEGEQRLRAAVEAGQSANWAEVHQHLRSSYKAGCNPLPTLRRKYSGTWMYHAAGKASGWNSVDGEVRFSQNPFEGMDWTAAWAGWQVSYIPATK